MKTPPALSGVLETVVYCDASNEADTKRFYSDVLGMEQLPLEFAFRIGDQVFLVFDADQSSVQDDPPPHGAKGSVHACFLVTAESYDQWKHHLEANGVKVTREIDWHNGVHSFYFKDPAGNLLEIADGDLWAS